MTKKDLSLPCIDKQMVVFSVSNSTQEISIMPNLLPKKVTIGISLLFSGPMICSVANKNFQAKIDKRLELKTRAIIFRN